MKKRNVDTQPNGEVPRYTVQLPALEPAGDPGLMLAATQSLQRLLCS
eukprot:CAMPEP_0172626522 /NCGR_PEP_ID=MMETSP1068-20121228/150721_1 /TAXON_ID=35684 /ORGANISM="Pseudopedinella elastica, Strain CCMP716" /LENGTH=46 /DNA_ID= /DNA_START= /DNA_END= /DNA_ORIENTATION=